MEQGQLSMRSIKNKVETILLYLVRTYSIKLSRSTKPANDIKFLNSIVGLGLSLDEKETD